MLRGKAYYLPWLVSMTWLAAGQQGHESQQVAQKRGLTEVFRWGNIDFAYPSSAARDAAIKSGLFVPESNLPLGLEVYENRLFVTLPRWRKGTPATLAWVPLDSPLDSPPLNPYPSWDWHVPGDCRGITTVFRLNVDDCGRLWVIDTGSEDILGSLTTTCPPKILVFDLKTDRLIARYELPKKQVKEGSLFTNIIADVVTCKKTYAYVNDVFRFGLIVYDLENNKSWRVENPYFFPEPLKSVYNHDGLKWRWNDGVFGFALSPVEGNRRFLYYHAMSSWREFRIDTSVLHNETRATTSPDAVELLGSRKRTRGNSSGQSMDRNGVLFYNLILQDAVGCWNSYNGEYSPEAQGIVDVSNVTLNFPNDLKVDHEPDQSVWVLSNKLHKFLYSKLDPNDFNTRILTMKTADAVKGTPCEPGYVIPAKKTRQCNEL
ncbi:Major royal jelly protein [Nesidiocoris tenuis]|uniref:Major royal jelly protein n=1 Tax=Nesidiocoris tenuis TaxID=355587 RepID=A0ABN7BFR0_9HEMI|nr:Major royal jelly protein [Nesidiocoris tenuis]